MHTVRFVRLFCLVVLLPGAALAATYEVGLGAGQIPQLAGVPWGALQAGDVVNIHPKPGGYREIIQVSAAGTAAQPIVIRGIPDPVTHELPVIDGDGAVMDPHVDFRNPVFEKLGLIVVTPRAQSYVYGKTFPAWITIESLALRNALYDASGVLHFTDQHGATRLYDTFACGIYIEFAQHLVVRGCEISFNGNGVFANSKYAAAAASSDLLIEKNYFHDNGQPSTPGMSNGFSEHHIYVEAVRATYQFNRFGPLRPNCHGCMIKDRSSGTVIRYNEVASNGSNVFAILDPQGGAGYIDAQPDYPDAFVYGNVITLLPGNGGNVVWFAACNGTKSYPTQHRGTLYFHHNTVVNHQAVVAAFSLTDPIYASPSPILEKVDARNNVFFTDTAINANVYQAFHLAITPGNPVIDLGLNWVSPGTLPSWTGHPFGGTINGWNNLIVGDAAGKNLPGFVDLAGGDYHLTSVADSIDAAGPLAAIALAKGHDITSEYVAPQDGVPRLVLGAHSDLGAFETSALYVPPPVNHAPVTVPQSVNLVGTAPAAITLSAFDPDGNALTFGYSTGGLVGTLAGKAPNFTYTPPAGSGSFIIGYNVNDGEFTSAPGYVFVSFNPPGNPPPAVALVSPAPGTVVAKSAPVALTAAASDANGVKQVDFYVGAKLVGTAWSAPYTINWSSAAAGTFQVVAKATDNLNAVSFSSPAFVTVP